MDKGVSINALNIFTHRLDHVHGCWRQEIRRVDVIFCQILVTVNIFIKTALYSCKAVTKQASIYFQSQNVYIT